MGLVDNDQIPLRLANVWLHLPREMVGADDDRVLLKGFRFPDRIVSLKVRLSKMAEGKKIYQLALGSTVFGDWPER